MRIQFAAATIVVRTAGRIDNHQCADHGAVFQHGAGGADAALQSAGHGTGARADAALLNRAVGRAARRLVAVSTRVGAGAGRCVNLTPPEVEDNRAGHMGATVEAEFLLIEVANDTAGRVEPVNTAAAQHQAVHHHP